MEKRGEARKRDVKVGVGTVAYNDRAKLWTGIFDACEDGYLERS